MVTMSVAQDVLSALILEAVTRPSTLLLVLIRVNMYVFVCLFVFGRVFLCGSGCHGMTHRSLSAGIKGVYHYACACVSLLRSLFLFIYFFVLCL